MPPRLSFVFITCNRRELLLDALQTVRGLPTQLSYEIVLVDNGSTDGTQDAVRQHFPEVRLFALRENAGVAGGRNVGAQHATGDILTFIDDDALLQTPSIVNILDDRFRANPNLAAVGFKIINDKADTVLRHEFPMRHHTPHNVATEQPASYFIGCGFAFRRDVFNQLGGFYTGMFYALEEVDISYQLVEQGYDLLYTPDIVVRHRTPPEVRRKGAWYYNFIRSRILMVLRNLPVWVALPHLFLWHGKLLWQSARAGHLRDYLRGVVDGWRHAGDALATRKPISFATAKKLHRELSGRVFY